MDLGHDTLLLEVAVGCIGVGLILGYLEFKFQKYKRKTLQEIDAHSKYCEAKIKKLTQGSIEDRLSEKFLNKPNNEQTRAEIAEELKKLMYERDEAMPRRKIDVEFSTPVHPNIIAITPKDIYSLMIIAGLEKPREDLPEDLTALETDRAIYRLYDSQGQLNPSVQHKLRAKSIEVTLKLNKNGNI